MTATNASRATAIAAGANVYFGAVCAKHPGVNGVRYVTAHICVACRDERKEARRRIPIADVASLRVRKRNQQRPFTRTRAAKQLTRVARRSAHFDGLTWLDVLAVWPKDDCCPVLGVPFVYGVPRGQRRDYAPSIDRFDPSKGYVRSNVSVISWRANRIKNNATADEVRRLLRWMETREPA